MDHPSDNLHTLVRVSAWPPGLGAGVTVSPARGHSVGGGADTQAGEETQAQAKCHATQEPGSGGMKGSREAERWFLG